MKTFMVIVILILHSFTLTGQKFDNNMYINLNFGIAENRINNNDKLTYQVGFRYQPSEVGAKVYFGQTDGLYHTFDSYGISGTWQPVDFIVGSLGYRYDNGRGWGDNRHGFNIGMNGLIALPTPYARIMIGVDTTFSDDTAITNVMIGVQLNFCLRGPVTNRFF